MTTIKCQFEDGTISNVPLENVALHTGKGIWGRDFIQHIAERTEDVHPAEIDLQGMVIVCSGLIQD